MAGEYKGSAGRVPVDSNGTSLADTTTSALKVVSVDSTGTALSGGGGSRVELLASETDTTLASTSTVLFSTTSGGAVNAALPSWCHSIIFEYRFNTFDDGAATAAGFQIQFTNTDPSGNAVSASNWISTSAQTPGAAVGGTVFAGRHVSGVAISVTTPVGGGTGSIAYCPFMWRNFKITRFYSVAPAVDGAVSAPWRLYAIGG